jgi:hypothetical protein
MPYCPIYLPDSWGALSAAVASAPDSSRISTRVMAVVLITRAQAINGPISFELGS